MAAAPVFNAEESCQQGTWSKMNLQLGGAHGGTLGIREGWLFLCAESSGNFQDVKYLKPLPILMPVELF